jgi:hypothetical protein
MKCSVSALALLLACGATVAQAAGTMSASVSFSNLSFSATDLRPADGIDPFFEILTSDRLKTSVSIDRDTPVFSASDSQTAFLATTSVSKTFSDGASALAQVTSNAVKAQASGPVTSSYAIQSNATVDGNGFSALIRIAPGTRLTFSGDAELQTSAQCGSDCYAQAVLAFAFGYFGEATSTTKTLFSDLTVPNRSYIAPLGLSYANTSNEDQFLGLVVRASVELGSSATAVPEPGSWALALGGGLLALGWGRRRPRG